MWAGTIQSTEGPNRTKRWRKRSLTSPFTLGRPSFPVLRVFLVLRLSDSAQITLLAFLHFQFAGSRLWVFLASVISGANSHNKLHIYIFAKVLQKGRTNKMSVCLSVCLSVSIYLSIYLPTYLSIYIDQTCMRHTRNTHTQTHICVSYWLYFS